MVIPVPLSTVDETLSHKLIKIKIGIITFAFVTSDDKNSFWRIAGPLLCRGARGSPVPPLSTALDTN